MRALILDDLARARVAEVIKHAQENRLTMIDIVRRLGRSEAVGDDDRFVIKIHDGYRVCYSIEQQPDPLNWCHHISVSVSQRGPRPCYPHEKAIAIGILPLFGLDMKNVAHLSLEKEVFAVNLLFKMNPQPS